MENFFFSLPSSKSACYNINFIIWHTKGEWTISRAPVSRLFRCCASRHVRHFHPNWYWLQLTANELYNFLLCLVTRFVISCSWFVSRRICLFSDGTFTPDKRNFSTSSHKSPALWIDVANDWRQNYEQTIAFPRIVLRRVPLVRWPISIA